MTAVDLMRLLSERLEWQDDALCAQTDPEVFYPEKGGSTRDAKRVCLGCEVRAQCLQYALDHDERFGVWGGRSEVERRKLRNTTPRPPRRRSKLTADEESIILARHAEGMGRQRIADELNVSRFAVQRVIERAEQNGAAA